MKPKRYSYSFAGMVKGLEDFINTGEWAKEPPEEFAVVETDAPSQDVVTKLEEPEKAALIPESVRNEAWQNFIEMIGDDEENAKLVWFKLKRALSELESGQKATEIIDTHI